jgi:hypothetical protein
MVGSWVPTSMMTYSPSYDMVLQDNAVTSKVLGSKEGR